MSLCPEPEEMNSPGPSHLGPRRQPESALSGENIEGGAWTLRAEHLVTSMWFVSLGEGDSRGCGPGRERLLSGEGSGVLELQMGAWPGLP